MFGELNSSHVHDSGMADRQYTHDKIYGVTVSYSNSANAVTQICTVLLISSFENPQASGFTTSTLGAATGTNLRSEGPSSSRFSHLGPRVRSSDPKVPRKSIFCKKNQLAAAYRIRVQPEEDDRIKSFDLIMHRPCANTLQSPLQCYVSTGVDLT